MKITALSIALFFASFFSSSCSSSNTLAPLSTVEIVAKEGTLANSVLAKDTSLAIRKLNGDRSAKVIKFVLQQPKGAIGRQAWREMWIYDPEGTRRSYVITFREDGQGSADFEIQPWKG